MEFRSLTWILAYLGIAISLLPLIIFLIKKKNFQQKIYWILFLLTAEYAFINSFNFIDSIFHYPRLAFFYEIHYIIETLLIGLLFALFLPKKVIFRSLLMELFILLLFAVKYIVFDEEFSPSSEYLAQASNVVITIGYISFQYKNSALPRLTDDGLFIIAIGLLFFSSVHFYFSIFDQLIRFPDSKVLWLLWPIFQVAAISHYLLFSIGLWKLRK